MFIQGQEYRRMDLHEKFGGQRQGGISTPSHYPLIFLFTSDSGQEFGYHDGWTADGIFLYTGEGQSNDMTFIRGNAAIRDHLVSEKDLHLFSYVRKGYVRYLGQMVCIGYFMSEGIDLSENKRQVIVFELSPLASLSEAIMEEGEKEDDRLQQLSLTELRNKALDDSAPIRDAHERKSMYRYRSHWIRLYALCRSNGVCEGCGDSAPFVTDNNAPYLEVHHIHRLSDGGPDNPNAVVAICPNCHRRAHYSIDRIEFKQHLLETVMNLEKQLT